MAKSARCVTVPMPRSSERKTIVTGMDRAQERKKRLRAQRANTLPAE